ncbi:ribonuclease P protein subunit p20-like isoform X1 [Cylas formicarius]|uniref:ribonuclease P protein subunit p20-like isoform X1 n=1 Tax=Cylas formicarius TaxID=197179 RepID=UPI002958371A|nr:ribonuclease P protein subunit p20-like isoform X1 [Cylas formicarius]
MAESGKQRPNRKNKQPNKYPNHVLRKRQPQKPEQGDSVIYVSTKTNIKALLEKCDKLINNNENEIIIYCLGAAIQRGVILALRLCEKHAAFEIDANTFTSELTDDLEPAVDEEDYDLQKRFNSALRIKVFRTNTLECSSQSMNS